MNINGLKISIIGAVRSGVSAAKLAKKLGAVPFVSELNCASNLMDNYRILKEEEIDLEFEGHSDRVFDCDLIVTSPGVPSNSPVLLKAAEKNIKVISELEFASYFCKGKIIAITGTNGKTTTTSLCEYVLKNAGIKATSAGNIGTAFSDVVLEIESDEYAVVEVSSFQLDHLINFKPFISVILNITPDHLDRYNDELAQYADAKYSIASNQNQDDYFIYNFDDEYSFKGVNNLEVNKVPFSINTKSLTGAYFENGNINYIKEGQSIYNFERKNLFIQGEHNLYNSLSVVAIAAILNIEEESLINSFKQFQGVEHRLEFVRNLNNVTFINDSKATNVESVWFALRSFMNPIVLILGGKDKGNDYKRIIEPVKNYVKCIIAIGSSSEKISDFFNEYVDVKFASSLEEAVEIGYSIAEKDEIVLLSPACASFDMFDNYEHRGEVFKKAVMELE